MPWWLARSWPLLAQQRIIFAAFAVVVTTLVACASLTPERAPLKWSLEDMTRSNEPTAGDVRWTYTLVIENPGRLPATLIREAVTLGWDGVYLSLLRSTRRTIQSRRVVGCVSPRRQYFSVGTLKPLVERHLAVHQALRSRPKACGSTGSSWAVTREAEPSF